jgi:hypothetical protein
MVDVRGVEARDCAAWRDLLTQIDDDLTCLRRNLAPSGAENCFLR